MYSIELGKSRIQVSTIAVGCMRVSDMSMDKLDEFVHTAMEHGANFFDHADIYGGGKSEDSVHDGLPKPRGSAEYPDP